MRDNIVIVWAEKIIGDTLRILCLLQNKLNHSVISQNPKQENNMEKYSDEVLLAEHVVIKRSTYQAHIISEVCAWTVVVVLLSYFII
jgi:hypothetical protein